MEKLQKEINVNQLEDLIKVLQDTFHSGKKIFVYSFGRSLLVGKAFAMRLMHLGFKSYVISEVVTPSLGVNDIFLVISKNLSNDQISVAIDFAKEYKAKIIIITSTENSPLLKKADNLLVVPYTSIKLKILGASTPLGTLFEISTMILLDCVIAELMSRLGTTEEEMGMRHANIQ